MNRKMNVILLVMSIICVAAAIFLCIVDNDFISYAMAAITIFATFYFAVQLKNQPKQK